MVWIHRSLLDSDALLRFSSLFRRSAVSITFLNSSLMLLAVDAKRKEKSELLMNVIRVFFLLSPQLRLSAVSVVFDFNDSLNDVAPLSPIILSVGLLCFNTQYKLPQQSNMQSTFQNKNSTRNDVHHHSDTLNRAFPFSTLYKNITNMRSLFSLLEQTLSQTLKVNGILPFPSIDEFHQNACFIVSFLCSL